MGMLELEICLWKGRDRAGSFELFTPGELGWRASCWSEDDLMYGHWLDFIRKYVKFVGLTCEPGGSSVPLAGVREAGRLSAAIWFDHFGGELWEVSY